MSRTTLALLALVIGLAGAVGGYFYGHGQGATAESARRDGLAVQQLGSLIDSHKNLIAEAGAASRAMRLATARREAADTKTTEELRDALKSTAGSRTGCVFPADVMRSIAAAQQRAAQAAARGIGGTVPAASGASAPGR